MTELNWRFSADTIDNYLQTVLPLPAGGCERGEERLACAMRYAVFSDGKRTRPLLLLEAASCIHFAREGKDNLFDLEMALPPACALELLHAYSLVHDDLPAMDNADMRRGQPATHKQWGEAMAILAGDALQSLAFDIAARIPDDDFWVSAEEPLRHLRVVRLIAEAVGMNGMAGGQALDIDWIHGEHGRDHISEAQLAQLQSMKTGAQGGAILGGGDEAQIEALRTYGEHLGRAFQIWDDVLDVEGDPSVMGKASSDADNLKMTYPAVVGMDESKRLARQESEAAHNSLQIFQTEADALRQLARFVVERHK